MSSNSFCKHLSNGYRIFIRNGKITWLPCCYWQGDEIPFENLQNRRDQLNVSTPWAHNECSKCRTEESYKPTGYRQAGHAIIPVIESTKTGWIDIQADETCNGGCLICGPWSSSYWQGQLIKYNEHPIVQVEKNLKQLVDQVFSSLDVSELGLLQFLGGEPFLSDVDQYALKYITNPSICQLKYTTNGSIYPKPDRIEQWSKFKKILINFSIDGVGKRFEYLRYPLKWSKVEDNVKRLIDEPLDNLYFHINHTITPLNIYYYDEFQEWVDRIFPKDRLTGIHTHTAYGTMNVSATSDAVRAKVIAKYGQGHMLCNMLASNTNQDSANMFREYINKWDQRRATDWSNTFPDIL
jgi:hypothetical protein